MLNRMPTLLILAWALCNLPIVQGSAAAFNGFTDTKGGAGGVVLRVTNLDAEGPGSLRAALEAEGARIVIFEVGGVVDLGKSTLRIRNPQVTIAGETAPSPGITLIRGGLSIATHDVIVRHLRVRPGDAGDPRRSGWEPDGLSTSGADAHDILIDHCSFTWAVDENLSASGPRTEGPDATSRRVTFRHCLIAEGLHDSTHAKGPHSKGTLIHDFCREIAVIGNLYAHNADRNPYFKAHTTGVIVNNVIYNPSAQAIKLGYSDSEWNDTPLEPANCRVSIAGNVFRHGFDTPESMPLVRNRGDAWMHDNIALDRDNRPVALVDGDIRQLEEPPVWPEDLAALPASAVEDHVVRNAGARPRHRDAIDARIIREFQERGGRIIHSQDEVGGYPEHERTRRPLDVPEDGVEAWLQTMRAAVEW